MKNNGVDHLKICWANTPDLAESDIVVIGIQDETGSHSDLRGTSKAPNRIRMVSNQRDVYTEAGQKYLAQVIGWKDVNVYDFGNIKKYNILKSFETILSFPKMPIALGGDHSITTSILKALAKKYGKISLVYFDAHPDFVSHTRDYHGSVITDSLDYIDMKSSLQIGIRSPEPEESDNLRKYGLRTITPFDFVEKGPSEISKIISDTVKDNVYVSFDMDCVDPAYAPGVSVPVPIGLQSDDVVYLVKKIVAKRVLGMDVVEVCPAYDLNDMTSHLASRLVGEVISSCKV